MPGPSLYPISQVDAFTTTPFEGNPCAVVYDADPLDDGMMLKIAREMNLSETAFVKTSTVATIGARYFTPEEELPLAGHPTIATVFSLFETGRLTFDDEEGGKDGWMQITLELKAGIIPIDVYAVDGKVNRVVMSQVKPKFLTIYDPSDVMPSLGLALDDVVDGSIIQTVSTGTPQLMIFVKSVNILRKIRIDSSSYKSMRGKGDFFSLHVFALRSIDDDDDHADAATVSSSLSNPGAITSSTTTTFARHFPEPEDPFTGSATGNMGAYLWHYGYIDSPNFIAEQGHWMGRPGQATVEVVGDRNNIDTVRVGGAAVTVMDGTLRVP